MCSIELCASTPIGIFDPAVTSSSSNKKKKKKKGLFGYFFDVEE
jgi:hypothetical protein